MTTQARFDAEMAEWLAGVQMQQRDDVTELDRLADLWLANGDAKAIRDPRPPFGDETHDKINGILSDMGY